MSITATIRFRYLSGVATTQAAFPEDVKCKCSFRITNVPDEVTSFSKIQVHAILYNYNPTFASDVMIFKNVPIY